MNYVLSKERKKLLDWIEQWRCGCFTWDETIYTAQNKEWWSQICKQYTHIFSILFQKIAEESDEKYETGNREIGDKFQSISIVQGLKATKAFFLFLSEPKNKQVYKISKSFHLKKRKKQRKLGCITMALFDFTNKLLFSFFLLWFWTVFFEYLFWSFWRFFFHHFCFFLLFILFLIFNINCFWTFLVLGVFFGGSKAASGFSKVFQKSTFNLLTEYHQIISELESL